MSDSESPISNEEVEDKLRRLHFPSQAENCKEKLEK